MDEQARTIRHSELVARMSRLLMDRISDVAKEVLEAGSGGFEGLIELKKLLQVERYCLQADIIAADLGFNIIITDDGQPLKGQFFQVVIENLIRGCRYRFLLDGELATQSPTVGHFRQMISEAVGGDRLHEYCFFRTTAWPVAGAPVLYKLDVPRFEKEDPLLFEQFQEYLFDDTWLGYLNRPNEESTADMLMTPSHVKRAQHTFEVLWNVATN